MIFGNMRGIMKAVFIGAPFICNQIENKIKKTKISRDPQQSGETLLGGTQIREFIFCIKFIR